MNKEDFYRLMGEMDQGYNPSHIQAIDLASFCETLLSVIEEAEKDGSDVFGTEGREHAIGWE